MGSETINPRRGDHSLLLLLWALLRKQGPRTTVPSEYENIRLFTHTDSEFWYVFGENSLSVGFNDRVERYGAFAIATDPQDFNDLIKTPGVGGKARGY